MQDDFVFTSESVTVGHPDKLCDQVSDAIIGAMLSRDPLAAVSAECAVATGIVFLSVLARTNARVDLVEVARSAIARAGYEHAGNGFDARSCSVLTSLHELPGGSIVDERTLTDDALNAIPARDAATVFGFACGDTATMMPLPISLAHTIARGIDRARIERIPHLGPDAKVQITIEYERRRPRRIAAITLVTSRIDGARRRPIEDELRESVLKPVLQSAELAADDRTAIFIDPEGPLRPGGPSHHSGLTGRKPAVDTYGGFARQGGYALSGKDPARIDRIGSYAARYVAKNVVAAGLAELCEVQLSYQIGVAAPVSVQVESYGTARISEHDIIARIRRVFDLRVAAIVRDLRLRELAGRDRGALLPALAVYGHMGREDLGVPWEATDRADALRG